VNQAKARKRELVRVPRQWSADLPREAWLERLAVFSGNKLQLQTDLVDYLEKRGDSNWKDLGDDWPSSRALDQHLRWLKSECSDLARYFGSGGIDFVKKGHSFRTMIMMTDILYSLKPDVRVDDHHRISPKSPFYGFIGAQIKVGRWKGNFELAYLKMDAEIDGRISREYGKVLAKAEEAQSAQIDYARIEAEAAEKVFGPNAMEEYQHWKLYRRKRTFFDFLEERAGG
jgi:hypothetical protein